MQCETQYGSGVVKEAGSLTHSPQKEKKPVLVLEVCFNCPGTLGVVTNRCFSVKYKVKIYRWERAAMKRVEGGVCAEFDVYLETLALTVLYVREW